MDKEYFRIHNWIAYHHGKASKCENDKCESVNPKRYEWALLKGMEYKRDRNNYIQLCSSCHRKYDMNEKTRTNMSNAKKGKDAKNKVSVMQYSKDGVYIKTFDSLTNAAKSVNGIPTAFSALKRGRLKTYKNYIWKFEQMNLE